MKAEDIFLDDWSRILIGEVPVLFLVEAIVRNVMIFIILMVSLRQMGQRMASQLGRNEMVSITALAAAVGVALQSPDRGLLATIIIAIIVVLIQQFIAKFTTKSETFEQLTQDSVSTLVEDGRLILKNMKTTRLTRERIFSQLRYKGLRHLGEVQRMYLEANGSFTILATKGPQPGLCILPGWDESFIKKVCVETESMVCQNCGTIQKPVSQECQQCGATSYTKGVL